MGEILVVIVIAAIVFGPMWLSARRGHASSREAGRAVGLALGEGGAVRPLQLVKAVLAGGLVANVLDTAVHGFLLGSSYYVRQTGLFVSGSVGWLVLSNFVAVAVFVGVYLRVRQNFRGGALGGATFGLYAGVLIGFPTHITLNLIIVDFPYTLAWAWTLHEVVWSVTVGAIIGPLVDRVGRRPAAAVQ